MVREYGLIRHVRAATTVVLVALFCATPLSAQDAAGVRLELGFEPTAVLYDDASAFGVAATGTVDLNLSATQTVGVTPFVGAQVGYQRGSADEHTQQDIFGGAVIGARLTPLAGLGGVLAPTVVRAGLTVGGGHISDDNGTTTEGVAGLFVTPHASVGYPFGAITVDAGVGYQLVVSSPTTKRALAVILGVRYALSMGGN